MATKLVTNGHGSNGHPPKNGSSRVKIISSDTATPQKVYERVQPGTNGHGSNGHPPKNGSGPQKPFSIETATADEMFERVNSFSDRVKPDPCPEYTAYEEAMHTARIKEKELFWQETVPTIVGVALIIIIFLGLLAVSVYAYYVKPPLTLPLN